MPTWDSIFSFALLDRLIEILKILAWPSVVLFSIVFFRERLTTLLNKITSAELPWGIKLDFDKEARKVEQKALELEKEEGGPKIAIDKPSPELNRLNSLLSANGMRPISSSFSIKHYYDIAQIDPKLSLAAVRIDLEAMLDNLIQFYKLPHKQHIYSLNKKANMLLESGKVTPTQYSIYMDILPLANEAVHGREPSLSSTNSVITAFGALLDDFAAWVKQNLS